MIQEMLDAIARLRQAAEGDKPKRGAFVVGAIVGAIAGGAIAHSSYPWPPDDWQDADSFDADDWDAYADVAELAIQNATWPA